MTTWRDLADDELGARLRARGLSEDEVTTLIRDREQEYAIAWINHHLGGPS